MLKNNIILNFIQRNKLYFVLALIAGMVSSMCTVVLSLSLGKFYEIFFNDAGNKTRIMHLIGINIGDNITVFFIFYGALLLIKGITEWTFYFFSKVTADRLSLSLRNKLFSRLVFSQPEAFAKKAPGQYLLRFSGDLQAIQNFFTQGIIIFLKDIFFLLMGCWFLMKADFRLALVVFLYIPLLPLVNYFFTRVIKNIIIDKRNRKSNLLSFVSERFFNMGSLKSFRKERIENRRFKKKSAGLYTTSVQYHRWYACVQALTSVLLYALPALLLFLVSVQEIPVSRSHLMAFILLIFMQLSALKRIGKVQTTWQAGLTSLNKITQLLQYPIENKMVRKEMMEFRTLEFSKEINGHQLIFKSSEKGLINFIDHPDAELLIKKLSGMMPDTGKEILINGLPLNNFSAAELRSIVGIASDHLPLYGSTVYDAAVKGRTAKKEIVLFEILCKLGFDSGDILKPSAIPLNQLSYQQKKLVMIARAVLTNASLLIFDKPFDGLDESTKNKCLSFFHSLLPVKTIVFLNSVPENIIENNLLSSALKERTN